MHTRTCALIHVHKLALQVRKRWCALPEVRIPQAARMWAMLPLGILGLTITHPNWKALKLLQGFNAAECLNRSKFGKDFPLLTCLCNLQASRPGVWERFSIAVPLGLTQS